MADAPSFRSGGGSVDDGEEDAPPSPREAIARSSLRGSLDVADVEPDVIPGAVETKFVAPRRPLVVRHVLVDVFAAEEEHRVEVVRVEDGVDVSQQRPRRRRHFATAAAADWLRAAARRSRRCDVRRQVRRTAVGRRRRRRRIEVPK